MACIRHPGRGLEGGGECPGLRKVSEEAESVGVSQSLMCLGWGSSQQDFPQGQEVGKGFRGKQALGLGMAVIWMCHGSPGLTLACRILPPSPPQMPPFPVLPVTCSPEGGWWSVLVVLGVENVAVAI